MTINEKTYLSQAFFSR